MIELLPFQSEDLERRFPQLTRAACQRELHLVDAAGRVFRGARGVAEMWRRLPGAWRVLGAIAAYPPVSWPAALVYRYVAKHRHSLGKSSDGCER